MSTLELLLEALEQRPEDQLAWLDRQTQWSEQTRAKVHRMMSGQKKTAAAFSTPVTPPSEDSLMLGSQVGHYRLTKMLGMGGMGAVFLGERADDFSHVAAIKLVRGDRTSEAAQERFAQERQHLAQLNHPYIAHLIDGGTTPEGVSYLTMEYVRGVSVTQFVRNQALDVREVMQLFVKICTAVEAAHSNLLVHGDIKPANVLINEQGDPKLLDFGIAQVLKGVEPEQRLTGALTPHYASPEQLAGERITQSSDVYSLGVLLRELLRNASGSTGSLTRRELDFIVDKATEQQSARRFSSVPDMIGECRRFLHNEPIASLSNSVAYRSRKFFQRHPLGSVLATLGILAVSAGLVIALLQANEAKRQSSLASQQRNLAEAERDRAEQIKDFLLTLFNSANVNAEEGRRPDVKVVELLDDAVERLTDSDLDPVSELELRTTFTELYESLLQVDDATRLARQTLDFLSSSTLADDALSQARAYRALGMALDGAGKDAQAQEAYLETRKALTQVSTEDKQSEAYYFLDVQSVAELANLYTRRGTCELGLPALQASLQEQQSRPKTFAYWRDRSALLSAVGICRNQRQEVREAYDVFKQVLEASNQAYPEGHATTAIDHANLGHMARGMELWENAETHYLDAISVYEQFLVPMPERALVMASLGRTYAQLDSPAKASRWLTEAVAAVEAGVPRDHYDRASIYTSVGRGYLRMLDFANADRFLLEAIRINELHRSGQAYVHVVRTLLASSWVDQKRYAEAEPLLLAAFEAFEQAYSLDNARTQRAIAELLRIYEATQNQRQLARFSAMVSR